MKVWLCANEKLLVQLDVPAGPNVWPVAPPHCLPAAGPKPTQGQASITAVLSWFWKFWSFYFCVKRNFIRYVCAYLNVSLR